MAIETLYDPVKQKSVMFDTVTDFAFGPVADGSDSEERLRQFIDWLPDDARKFTDSELSVYWFGWLEAPISGKAFQ